MVFPVGSMGRFFFPDGDAVVAVGVVEHNCRFIWLSVCFTVFPHAGGQFLRPDCHDEFVSVVSLGKKRKVFSVLSVICVSFFVTAVRRFIFIVGRRYAKFVS